jgi:hypothetical protein
MPSAESVAHLISRPLWEADMTTKTKTGSDQKLKELILLLARESEGEPNFGAVKLNKELFYSDFFAYLYLGKPITGHEYIAMELGPGPKYKLSIIHEMERQGELAVRKHAVSRYQEDRVFALREPNLKQFTPEEIQLVHDVLKFCHEKTGKDLSTDSHAFLGWSLAAEKEIIPYPVMLIGTRGPTSEEIKWGHELESLELECLERNGRAATEVRTKA